jgi:hypothetical protein
MLPNREIACADADCRIDDRSPELLGRKRWSTCDVGGIIDRNKETNTVKWGPGNH